MIPRHDGTSDGRSRKEAILRCEEHRDWLHNGYLQAIVDGRPPTADQAAEHRRRERESRTVARMRARAAVKRAAERVVAAEYQWWLNGGAA